MAKQVKLKVEPRTATGRSAARRLKARGIVPAVVYGGKEKSQPLQVSARDINAMLSHASGENILVELEIAGQKATRTALLQEVQHSPVGGDVLHVDFHAISMDEKIQADVPLEPLGVPNGVKNFGGLLDQNLRALAIECLPRDLPDKITVDVSALNIGDSIHVRDIKLPSGVTAKVQPDLTAFSVMAPVIEEEPVVAEAEAAAGPEVITAKKEEGEAAAPAPGGKGAAAAGAKGAPGPAGKGAPAPAGKGGAPAPAPKEKEQKK
ncbi:MAG TPA: 50S ribosomal protein L25 [Chthoniobacterales bacterium]|jgi:large subunit ribosomal protein L25|nr:50S ribosomal protein L25 [Chthoniobacterales bacterium]